MVSGLSLTFRVWELLVLTVALQTGMLPLMARDFHRIPLSAPIVNLAAVPLTGLVGPLGFLTMLCGCVSPLGGTRLSRPLSQLPPFLLSLCRWSAHFCTL